MSTCPLVFEIASRNPLMRTSPDFLSKGRLLIRQNRSVTILSLHCHQIQEIRLISELGNKMAITSAMWRSKTASKQRHVFSNRNPDCPSQRTAATSARQAARGNSTLGANFVPIEAVQQTGLEVENQRPWIRLQKESYGIGDVFWAPLHEEDFRRGHTYGINSTISRTPNGEFVHSKTRPHIIIALFREHFIAVPVYTHQGNGLHWKQNTDEFVSVCDMPGTFEKLSDYDALHTEQQRGSLDPRSVAWLTHPVSRGYDLHVRPEGRLTENSTQYLLYLYFNLMTRCFRDES